MRRFALLLLATAAGCTFYDGRGRFDIEPAGELTGCLAVRFRVAASDADGAYVRVDDGPEVRYTTNTDLAILLPQRVAPAPGQTQRFRVRARSEGGFSREVERGGAIDCAPLRLTGQAPSSGPVDGAVPLTVRATFSLQLDPASVAPGSFAVTPLLFGAAPVAFDVELEPDWRAVRVKLRQPLDRVGPVRIQGHVVSVTGVPLSFDLGDFQVPVVQASFDLPVVGAQTNGVLPVVVRVGTPPPPQIALYVDGTAVATLSGPPWTHDLDTRSLAEGTHQLSLRTPGAYLTGGNGPSFVVDRTPPRVTRCEPVSGDPQDLPSNFEIRLETSEGVTAEPVLLVDGGPFGLWNALTGILTPRSAVTAPAVVEVVWPGGQDLAGNALVPFTCALRVPLWRRPWGSGPLSTSAGPIVADAVVWGEGPTWTVPTGQPGAGDLHSGAALASGLWDPGPRLNAFDPLVPGELAGSGQAVAWIEASTGGKRVFVRRTQNLGSTFGWRTDPVGGAIGADPREIACDAQFGPWGVAWTELDALGRRRIAGRADLADSSQLGPVPIPDLRLDPAAQVSSPVISVSNLHAWLAWIETTPAGSALLRVATRAFTAEWFPGASSLEADPAASPAEPAFMGNILNAALAWREGDTVLARFWDDRQLWRPAVALNTAPGRRARSPRILGGSFTYLVCFVETGVSGDEIWCRSWTGADWSLVPEPVNAGVPGSVAGLWTGGLVLWRDGAGRLFARQLNP